MTWGPLTYILQYLNSVKAGAGLLFILEASLSTSCGQLEPVKKMKAVPFKFLVHL